MRRDNDTPNFLGGHEPTITEKILTVLVVIGMLTPIAIDICKRFL
jgi:hypothetical protein